MRKNNSIGEPLVSVGIPTYNRPEGLERTLKCIASQTYRNLEILISDNASAGPETAAVANAFTSMDTRIVYVRQSQNLGAIPNFRFLLQRARGEFFMWAADDDEWHPRFVAACLEAIGECGTSCSLIGIVHRPGDERSIVPTPLLSPDQSNFINARKFLFALRSSLFYGIHRRETIKEFLTDRAFDYYDCFFLLRQILSHGVTVIPEILYWAGIDGKSYTPKPLNPKEGRVFDYMPFLLGCSSLVIRSRKLRSREKMILLITVLQVTAREFAMWEAKVRPAQAKMGSLIARFAKLFNKS